MRAGRSSRTAEQNALFRALEARRPANQRLFDDRFARTFLTWPLSLVDQLAALPGLRILLPWIIDTRWPGVRSCVVARTRLIDDMIAAALRENHIEQMVILGAGFDSRAYRLPETRSVTVFEVDHPDTQAAKRAALERTSSIPANVRYVATDFNQRTLSDAMAAAGYRESANTFILWEGTTNYLTEDAVDATLRWCSRARPGSLVLFTYVHRDILTRPAAFVGTKALFAALEKSGERFTFGLEPAELREFLARRGLALESDVGATELRQRYYGDAARAMRGHEFYRVALARVAHPAANDPTPAS